MPLLSPKSYSKLHIVPSLMALARMNIPLRGIDLSPIVLKEEARVLHEDPNAAPRQAVPESTLSWAYSGISSVWGTATSYLRSPPEVEKKPTATPRDIDDIAGGRVPNVLLELSTAILKYCVTTEGIFRRSAKVSTSGPLLIPGNPITSSAAAVQSPRSTAAPGRLG